MVDPNDDAWRARLSELVDGELALGEAREVERHVATCAECARTLADLRRIAERASALPREVPPPRDLWPAIEARLEPARTGRSRLPLALAAFAAGVLVTLGVGALLRGDVPDDTQVARGETYLLLLRDPPSLGAELDAAGRAAVVERYARWARGLGARCAGGEELAPGGWRLEPDRPAEPLPEDAAHDVLGGYFVVRAASDDDALALARDCPHLARGGSIELRRVRTRD